MRSLRIVPALLALAVALALGACSAPGVSSSPTQTGNAVGIQDNAFNPQHLETASGVQVKWANNDSVAHRIVADDGSFDSGVLEENRTFRHTFSTAGTVSYHCALHPAETGSVVVK